MTGPWSAILLGAATGLFATAAWRLAVGQLPPLAVSLEGLDAPPRRFEDATDRDWRGRLGRQARPLVPGFGHGSDRVAADARMAGVDLDAHLASKLLCALLPTLFAIGIAGLLWVTGSGVPTALLFATAVAGVGVGFVLPDLTLRRVAAERRREFTIAFGAYLDLVAISLAGGMGTEAALVEASRVGDSWCFLSLRRTIHAAQIDGDTVWSAFSRLGTELAVPALGELAASVALAGGEGAKVRQSIATKADALRAIELAAAESHAQAATERMALPTAMLLFGFVLLIGFPAVATVLGGL